MPGWGFKHRPPCPFLLLCLPSPLHHLLRPVLCQWLTHATSLGASNPLSHLHSLPPAAFSRAFPLSINLGDDLKFQNLGEVLSKLLSQPPLHFRPDLRVLFRASRGPAGVQRSRVVSVALNIPYSLVEHVTLGGREHPGSQSDVPQCYETEQPDCPCILLP